MKIHIIQVDCSKYEKNTPAWHCAIDLTYFDRSIPVSIQYLAKCHSQTESYYETYLPILEQDTKKRGRVSDLKYIFGESI